PGIALHRSGDASADEQADRCGSIAERRSFLPAPRPEGYRLRRPRPRHYAANPAISGHAPSPGYTAFCVLLLACLMHSLRKMLEFRWWSEDLSPERQRFQPDAAAVTLSSTMCAARSDGGPGPRLK